MQSVEKNAGEKGCLTNGKTAIQSWTKRARERGGSTHWDKRKEGKAENKMTQHGWLASRF